MIKKNIFIKKCFFGNTKVEETKPVKRAFLGSALFLKGRFTQYGIQLYMYVVYFER